MKEEGEGRDGTTNISTFELYFKAYQPSTYHIFAYKKGEKRGDEYIALSFVAGLVFSLKDIYNVVLL